MSARPRRLRLPQLPRLPRPTVRVVPVLVVLASACLLGVGLVLQFGAPVAAIVLGSLGLVLGLLMDVDA